MYASRHPRSSRSAPRTGEFPVRGSENGRSAKVAKFKLELVVVLPSPRVEVLTSDLLTMCRYVGWEVGGGGGEGSPTSPPSPLKRDPGAGRIVVEVAQDRTPLHHEVVSPTGVGGRSSVEGRGETHRWENGNPPRNRPRDSLDLFLTRALTTHGISAAAARIGREGTVRSAYGWVCVCEKGVCV